jgi:exopolysaccharide biosynthesis polyprenyl glycosylphosphotransferase
MNVKRAFSTAFLVMGDLAALFAALFISLTLRAGGIPSVESWKMHLPAFRIVFIIYIACLFISGLYDRRKLKNSMDFFKALFAGCAAAAVVSLAFFYLAPHIGISPKTTLAIYIAVSAMLISLWRRSYNRNISSEQSATLVLVIGEGQAVQEVKMGIKNNPQLGFRLVDENVTELSSKEELIDKVKKTETQIVITSRNLKKDSALASGMYELLRSGVVVMDLVRFSEISIKKIPLSEIDPEWLIDHLSGDRFYDQLKRAIEVFGAVVFQIILLAPEVLVALLIKLTSSGPVIYSQQRIGKDGRLFKLYKFRSMKVDAEKDGAKWASSKDPRTTAIGGFLRASHIDEFPQLINIINGDLSFVGPRPERPEFTERLAGEIPYFESRLLVVPGLTGWAQINFRYGATVDDSREKLQYDLYYIKNRSLLLDALVFLRTIQKFFINEK